MFSFFFFFFPKGKKIKQPDAEGNPTLFHSLTSEAMV